MEEEGGFVLLNIENEKYGKRNKSNLYTNACLFFYKLFLKGWNGSQRVKLSMLELVEILKERIVFKVFVYIQFLRPVFKLFNNSNHSKYSQYLIRYIS